MTEAQLFLEAMKPFEDPTGAVDPNSDNSILFTVTKYVVLRGLKPDELLLATEASRCFFAIRDRKLAPGVYCRHPGETWPSSWDDHLAAEVFFYLDEWGVRGEMLVHAKQSGFSWGTNWLGRIPLFRGVVTHCGGDKLSLWEQWLVAGSYIGNLWEKREESSGKILLWLASLAFEGSGYPLIALAILIWKVRMNGLYPGGPAELLAVYHSKTHPFAVYGPKSWR